MPIKRFARFAAGIAVLLALPACDQQQSVPVGLEAVYDSSRFRLQLSQQRLSVYDRQLQRSVFSSAARDLISAQQTAVNQVESNGSYRRTETLIHSCSQAKIERAEPYSEYFLLIGSFQSPGCELKFYLRFAITDQAMHISASTSDENYNQLSLGFDSAARETIMGFGTQVSKLNFKGLEVPVWVQRQGIGRGEQPQTAMLNATTPGAAGNSLSSAYIIPHFLSDQRYGIQLENSEYSRFDFRQPDTTYIHVQSAALKLQFFSCPQLLGCIEQMTGNTGRMQPLPDWVHNGAIIGLQGGTEQVLRHYQSLKNHAVPISAILVHDWAGADYGPASPLEGIPRQLGSNWQTDRSLYPEWAQLLEVLQRDGVRVLGYLNPYLVKSDTTADAAGNLYAQAAAKGYLVKLASGQIFQTGPGSRPSGLVDLSNPQAFSWFKAAIKTTIEQLQWSGWMADLGENFPLDAALEDGQEALLYHNLFPLQWARLNAAIQAELDQEKQPIFMVRAGYTQSPGVAPLFWLGNQTTTWDAGDGLQSVAIGLLNGGLSGQSITHADIGGATSIQLQIPALAGRLLPEYLTHTDASDSSRQTYFTQYRQLNLLKRWIELSAFTPVFRSHEGLTPELNAQVYDPGVLQHFARFAQLFTALAPYRQRLLQEAFAHGWPLVRHPILHYPEAREFLSMAANEVQFMLGDSILVAPMLTPRNEKLARAIFLPEGEWLELWSQDLLMVAAPGLRLEVTPKMGEPPVYLLLNDTTRTIILPALSAAGFVREETVANIEAKAAAEAAEEKTTE